MSTASETTATSTAVHRTVDVAVPPDHAFEVFAQRFDTWWTRGFHILDGELKAVGIEPFVGGRVWEESVSGETCTWGWVLQWDPGRSLAFSWLIGPTWDIPEPDAAGSVVTVTFTPIESGTQVDVVHSDLDRHGADWADLKGAIAGPGGWTSLLRQFAAVVD